MATEKFERLDDDEFPAITQYFRIKGDSDAFKKILQKLATNTMKRTTIITGPQGSGKTAEAMRIVAGRRFYTAPAYGFYSHASTDLNPDIEVIVVEEVNSLALIMDFVEMKNIAGKYRCPDLILITNIDVGKDSFNRDDVEVIVLAAPIECTPIKENWRIGKGNVVVSDFTTRINCDREDEQNYYGGFLVCESVQTKEHLNLISAAPDMLETLMHLQKYMQYNDLGDFFEEVFKQKIKAAIDKAEGKVKEKPKKPEIVEMIEGANSQSPFTYGKNKYNLFVNKFFKTELWDYAKAEGAFMIDKTTPEDFWNSIDNFKHFSLGRCEFNIIESELFKTPIIQSEGETPNAAMWVNFWENAVPMIVDADGHRPIFKNYKTFADQQKEGSQDKFMQKEHKDLFFGGIHSYTDNTPDVKLPPSYGQFLKNENERKQDMEDVQLGKMNLKDFFEREKIRLQLLNNL